MYTGTVKENIIDAPKYKIIFGALLECNIFQYCDNNMDFSLLLFF